VKTLLGALLAGCPSLSSEGTIEEAESLLRQELEQGTEGADEGPRSSPGTKLGAILGLKCIGSGAVRKLLESTRKGDQSETLADGEGSSSFDDAILRSSPLARVGRWSDSWEKENGDEENQSMIDEIKVSFLWLMFKPLKHETDFRFVSLTFSPFFRNHFTLSFRLWSCHHAPKSSRRNLQLSDLDMELSGSKNFMMIQELEELLFFQLTKRKMNRNESNEKRIHVLM